MCCQTGGEGPAGGLSGSGLGAGKARTDPTRLDRGSSPRSPRPGPDPALGLWHGDSDQ